MKTDKDLSFLPFKSFSPFREGLYESEQRRKGKTGKEKSREEAPGLKPKPPLLPRTGDRLVGLSSYGLNRMAGRTCERDTQTANDFYKALSQTTVSFHTSFCLLF